MNVSRCHSVPWNFLGEPLMSYLAGNTRKICGHIFSGARQEQNKAQHSQKSVQLFHSCAKHMRATAKKIEHLFWLTVSEI